MIDLFTFIEMLQRALATGEAREHAYRPALQALFESVEEGVDVVNEPPRKTNVGAPDFIFLRGVVPLGHVEAKDIDIDVTKLTGYSVDQQARYRAAFPNLIYTNGLDWVFFVKGEQQGEAISIARLEGGTLTPLQDNFVLFRERMAAFVAEPAQSIRSAEALAKMMAGKATMIRETMTKTLEEEIKAGSQSELVGQFLAFKQQLLHDLDPAKFGDLYAETIAYGLFAARLHDTTLEDFSRQEALELLPKTNPFLRKLFQYVAGYDLDDRIAWIVDDLCEVFRATNLAVIMEDFGRLTGRNDPFLHFYETFLAHYDPAKREAAGVYYTPEAVVQFIVRAVDEVLRTDFGIKDGLADTSKVMVRRDNGQGGVWEEPMHRVQVLDPATGTGTFLAEVIKLIAPRIRDVAAGMWPQYVEAELIPRLHGFELLMAAYSMCHLKLEMVLKELGYVPTDKEPRLNVFLTNSLEEAPQVDQTLFGAQWLSDEANAANRVKRDTPVMCVIGNPPYSGESQNKGAWIMDLMEAYKKEPGGKEKLKERNPKWINDDYVKFIRFSEHIIAKNGEGVLGFITNHGYLDNPTFRGMRWHLLKTFDKIYVIDLHGNAKKKEVSPDGSADKNVFDIQQGVAIIIAVKKKNPVSLSEGAKAPKSKGTKPVRGSKTSKIAHPESVLRQAQDEGAEGLAQVYHLDLWGTRKAKSEALDLCLPSTAKWTELENRGPAYLVVPKDYELESSYAKSFSLRNLMATNSVGIVTARDSLVIDEDREQLRRRIQDFKELDPEIARQKYKLGKDVRDWRVSWAQSDVVKNYSEKFIRDILYRPFDQRWTHYTGNSRGIMCYPRRDVMRQYLNQKNYGFLLTKRIEVSRDFCDIFVHSNLVTHHTLSIKEVNYSAPLYLYPDENDLDQERTVNFDPDIHAKILETATPAGAAAPDEVAIFDYIYGALHDPGYRETYADFLKSDFPRVPYPRDPETFAHVSALGSQLRQLHLMDQVAIDSYDLPTSGFPEAGDNEVDKITFRETSDGLGQVYINKNQYFDAVPTVAWNFYIGGYQPAQKWLKDRKGRTLSFDDLRHYQNIIKILTQTPRLMAEINLPL